MYLSNLFLKIVTVMVSTTLEDREKGRERERERERETCTITLLLLFTFMYDDYVNFNMNVLLSVCVRVSRIDQRRALIETHTRTVFPFVRRILW